MPFLFAQIQLRNLYHKKNLGLKTKSFGPKFVFK